MQHLIEWVFLVVVVVVVTNKGFQREYIDSNNHMFHELLLSLQTPSPNKRQ